MASALKDLSKTKKALGEALVEANQLRMINHQNVIGYFIEKARLTAESVQLSKLIENATWGTTVREQDLCV